MAGGFSLGFIVRAAGVYSQQGLGLHNRSRCNERPSGEAWVCLAVSSREIAELTGKRHDNVMADIRGMFNELEIHSPEFSGQYKDSTGRTLPCFNLPKRETCLMAMSSREIAELTGKEHRNVMADIRNMLAELYGDGGVLNFQHTQVNQQNGQSYPVFNLPKRETLILVSGLTVGKTIIEAVEAAEPKGVEHEPAASI